MDDGAARLVEVPVARAAFRYGAPIAAALALHGAFNLVDLLVVGRLNTPGLAAGVNVASILVTAPFLLFDGVCNAAVARIARARGARDDAAVRRFGGTLLALAILGGLLTARPFLPFANHVLGGYAFAGDAARAGGASYLRIMCDGAGTMFVLLAATAVLRGRGDVRAPVVLLVAANVLNLVLSVGLAFGRFGLPERGVEGVAYATVISRSACALPALWLVRAALRPKGESGRSLREAARGLMADGIPTALQLVVRVASFLVVLRFAAHAAGAESAPALLDGVNAAQRLEMIGVFAVLGFGAAATALVGAAAGARDFARARAAAAYSAAQAAAAAALFGVGAWVFRGVLLRGIEPGMSAEATAAAEAYWARILTGLPLFAVGAVYSRAMNGLLDAATPLRIDLLVYLLGLPAAVATAIALGGGPNAVWGASAAAHAVAAYFLYQAFVRKASLERAKETA